MSLPALPANATRFTGAAHVIEDSWLVVGFGAPEGPAASAAGVLVPFRLDLRANPLRWEPIPAYPLAGQAITVPISAVVSGKWLVFGGQTQFAETQFAGSSDAAVA